jgi:8-oxo-dGTP pyrophosphatase MutT (NUDIX family)
VGEKKKEKVSSGTTIMPIDSSRNKPGIIHNKSGKSATSKPVLREFSAGGVVYKRSLPLRGKKVKSQKSNVKSYWLVTRSNPSKDYPRAVWRLPKGRLDDSGGGELPGPYASGLKKAPEELMQKAALREVAEEAGVEAAIIQRVITDRYFFTLKGGQKILKFVTFYLMEWKSDIPSGFGSETSKIGWYPYQEARKTLSYSGERKILDKAKEILDRGLQINLL